MRYVLLALMLMPQVALATLRYELKLPGGKVRTTSVAAQELPEIEIPGGWVCRIIPMGKPTVGCRSGEDKAKWMDVELRCGKAPTELTFENWGSASTLRVWCE